MITEISDATWRKYFSYVVGTDTFKTMFDLFNQKLLKCHGPMQLITTIPFPNQAPNSMVQVYVRHEYDFSMQFSYIPKI